MSVFLAIRISTVGSEKKRLSQLMVDVKKESSFTWKERKGKGKSKKENERKSLGGERKKSGGRGEIGGCKKPARGCKSCRSLTSLSGRAGAEAS